MPFAFLVCFRRCAGVRFQVLQRIVPAHLLELVPFFQFPTLRSCARALPAALKPPGAAAEGEWRAAWRRPCSSRQQAVRWAPAFSSSSCRKSCQAGTGGGVGVGVGVGVGGCGCGCGSGCVGGLYLTGHLRCRATPSASFGSRGLSHGCPRK
jgi:hypothetical protein